MDIDLGPLGVLYSWQSCVVAFLITTFTHGIKALIDFKMGGKETRQQSLFVNSILLPATPIVLGGLVGAILPLRPEELIKYLADHSITGWSARLVFAGYGMAVGQFSTYVWDRYSSVLAGVKARAVSAAADVPTPPMGTPAVNPPAAVPTLPAQNVPVASTPVVEAPVEVLPPKPPELKP